MTVKERALEVLTSKGIFPSHAEQVFQLALPKMETPDNPTDWDIDASEYPDPMYRVWAMILRDAALEWIDTNLPEAWYRLFFLPEDEHEKSFKKNIPYPDPEDEPQIHSFIHKGTIESAKKEDKDRLEMLYQIERAIDSYTLSITIFRDPSKEEEKVFINKLEEILHRE